MRTATPLRQSHGPGGHSGRSQSQLRRDRIVAVMVLALFAVLFALMVWLVMLTGGAHTSPDMWMMP